MELLDTVDLMKSFDFKSRFLAEYFQLKIRKEKLEIFIEKYKRNDLNFKPLCSLEIFEEQLNIMNKYLKILEKRAEQEKIKI